jgi:hypothetical protein
MGICFEANDVAPRGGDGLASGLQQRESGYATDADQFDQSA